MKRLTELTLCKSLGWQHSPFHSSGTADQSKASVPQNTSTAANMTAIPSLRLHIKKSIAASSKDCAIIREGFPNYWRENIRATPDSNAKEKHWQRRKCGMAGVSHFLKKTKNLFRKINLSFWMSILFADACDVGFILNIASRWSRVCFVTTPS